MSFSFSSDGHAKTIKERIDVDNTMPAGIKTFLHSGVDALMHHYGDDVHCTVRAYGHLHTGADGNFDVTSATIEIKRTS